MWEELRHPNKSGQGLNFLRDLISPKIRSILLLLRLYWLITKRGILFAYHSFIPDKEFGGTCVGNNLCVLCLTVIDVWHRNLSLTFSVMNIILWRFSFAVSFYRSRILNYAFRWTFWFLMLRVSNFRSTNKLFIFTYLIQSVPRFTDLGN